uniref:Uncharacterized protein n=1 Tax=Trichobilharzia regenti TaxID=157069 RepID=A0AA85J1W0_TRIRE|nr:unnamed protein product [Trichobilharzia regenti]
MVFQMTKLNLIIFISVSIVSFEVIESGEMPYVISFDKSGEKQVIKLWGVEFTLNNEYKVIVTGSNCTWTVDMKQANDVEVAKGGGTRDGSLVCKDWNRFQTIMPIPNQIK